ncbi:MAG: hypothetical protein PHU25_07805 [Deltaproteobacteria bacterium]|nr:hypothetical protein [Deltaproteobacteria bacterium]
MTDPAGQRRGSRIPIDRRLLRRAAMAVSASLLLHLVLLLAVRPDFRSVADEAVDMEVLKAEPGPPPQTPTPPAPEPPPKPAPASSPENVARTASDSKAHAPPQDSGPQDSGSQDAGDAAVAARKGDAGPAEGGTCMHDLFPFAGDAPSWMLWISVGSLRDTAYESGVAGTLSAFSLYRRMTEATSIDAGKDVAGLLVTATDVLDPRTFRVSCTYDSGEDALLARLRSAKGASALQVTKTAAGYEAQAPGGFLWHLVGSGRVLVVEHAPTPVAPKTPDAGPQPGHGSRDWPSQVACLAPPARGARAPDQGPKPDAGLIDVARAALVPRPDGHWPVVMLVTSDPRAVGLGSRASTRAPAFRSAEARVFLTDPVRVEGRVRFAGTAEQVAGVAAAWKAWASASRSDPMLNLFGLGHMLDGLVLTASGTDVRFELPMTTTQIQAALFFLQTQGQSLDRRPSP